MSTTCTENVKPANGTHYPPQIAFASSAIAEVPLRWWSEVDWRMMQLPGRMI
ncbi:hypothetical protein ACKFKF_15835 [Phormidesmis sp. 146-12]